MNARKILLIDDSADFRTKVRESLGGVYFITDAASEAEFRAAFRPYTYDLVILDMRLETGREGLRLLRDILAYDELQPVIMVSAYGDTEAVLDATESGALMFLHKQEFTPELLARMVEAVLQQARIRKRLAVAESRIPGGATAGLTSVHPAMRRVTEQIQQAADDPHSMVVITGEAGAGQDMVAREIHTRSRKRCQAPLIVASGLSAALAVPSSAFFGSPGRSGIPRMKGLVEQANSGILFLEHLDRVASEAVKRLGETLRGHILTVGNDEPPIPLDFQLVVGINRKSASALTDMLWKTSSSNRLVEIHLPPLRERRQDIPVLAALFLQEFREAGRTTAQTLRREALSALEEYPWPGNLPELRNTIEYGAIQALVKESEEVANTHLPIGLLYQDSHDPAMTTTWDYQRELARAEIALTAQVVEQKRSISKTQLAKLLGYKDRYVFSRRVRKALKEFPEVAAEFPKVGGMFPITE